MKGMILFLLRKLEKTFADTFAPIPVTAFLELD